MLSGLLSDDDVFIGAVLFILMLEALYCFCRCWPFPHHGCQRALRKRMCAYALLKENTCNSQPKCCDRLSPLAHEVLLGTLKKVEQKSLGLNVFLVLALTVGANVALNHKFGGNDIERLVLLLLTALLLPLFSSFRGLVQIDQADFIDKGDNQKEIEPAADSLQRQLLDDLMGKEQAFRFSLNTTKWSVSIFFFVVLAYTICNLLQGPI